MNRRVWHPSKRRLRSWLEEGDARLDAHIDGCTRCAAKLEDLSQPTVSLAEALHSMLAPPDDLQDKLRVGIARKLDARADLELLGEMFSIPYRTVQALSADPPDDPEDSKG